MTPSPRPNPSTLPRRISFGATPSPSRPPNTRSRSTSSPKTAALHHQFVSADKAKSMAELDKEAEVRMAEVYKGKVKKGGFGVVDWFVKIVGGKC
ncbi:hypothetical protein EKO04_003793 [Ascochyta lentis]|uniref:Uncharacterized protein n=1 Tax=Ascochyta lentis TaxID=205686 RepID=A0A8H7J782_9PLEO|nr:hypothetical protein EKO04_003793 [Ascochyta lentis]